MKHLFWYFVTAISGGLIGISIVEFFILGNREHTIYLFISGLILAAVGIWGMRKYLGMGFFSNKQKSD